jgi:dimethylhistidine N-methyltransferase
MTNASPILNVGPASEQFRSDVLRGLRRRHKTLPCKYFYDAAGSRLFDAICGLPEYYPTRTELAILRAHADDMAQWLGPKVALIEYGSGSSVKTRLVLEALDHPAAYLPVDISGEHLHSAARQLAIDYPQLIVRPVCADFTRPIQLPDELPSGVRRIVYFPGSTIGNFSPRMAVKLLRGMARLAGLDGGVLLGADLKKSPRVLEAAYDDAAGVTAQFNLNLLARINRELGGNFDLKSFRHHALYQPRFGRIEMHLISTRQQRVRIAGELFEFAEGESIHTENSYKYTIAGLTRMAKRAGLRPRATWSDPRRWFSVLLLSANAVPSTRGK